MRFEVEEMPKGVGDEDSYYRVIDKQALRWNLPDQAVSIFFGKRASAQAVVDLLNKEWASFLRNPR